MALGRKKTVEIDFIADTSQATRGMKQVGDTADKEGSRLQSMGDKAKAGFAAAAVGVGLAIDFLKDAAVAAAEDQAAQADLELAIKNTTNATDDQIAATEDWISKTAKATGVADDKLRPALEELVRVTGDLGEAQDLLGVAMDISAAKGLDLETVTIAMGKAALGNVGALGRLGIATRDAEGNMLSFEQVMAEANRTMGGAMETAAGTGQGALNRLQVQFDEAKESLGGALIPVLIDAADAVTAFFDALEQGAPETDKSPFAQFGRDVRDIANIGEDPHIQGIIQWFKDLDERISIFEDSSTRFGMATGNISRETQDARRLGLDPLTGALVDVVPAFEDAEGAARDTARAVDDSTEAFYDNQAAVRAQFDPVFAYAEAQRKLKEAIDKATEAGKGQAKGSPEHIEALEGVRDAAADVQAAEAKLAETTGVTRSTMESHLRSLRVFTEQQIQLMLDEFDRINAFRFDTKSITIVRRITGGGPQEFHTGGTVQGDFPGQEVLVSARAGEHVSQGGTPAHNGHGGQMIHNIINIDGRKWFEEVVLPQMARYSRRNGGLGI